MGDESLFYGDAEVTARATVLAQTVISIRTAQGKSLPSNFPVGSVEWEAAEIEFAEDINRVLAGTAC